MDSKFKVIISDGTKSSEGRFDFGTSILTAAEELGVGINHPCGGEQICGKCKAIIEDGMENVTPLTKRENELLSATEMRKNYRLACAARVKDGPVSVKIPKSSQTKSQIALTEGSDLNIAKETTVKKYPVKIPAPSLNDHTADFERISEALEKQYGISAEKIDYFAQKDLPHAVREKEKTEDDSWNTSLIVWNEEEILDIEPGPETGIYGLAVDLGTTTIAGYLMDLVRGETVSIDSCVNPQRELGGDLITRISKIVENKETRNEAQSMVIDSMNEMIEDLCNKAGIENEEIYEISLCGNTGMHHLFLGIYPEYVSLSPYPAGRQGSFYIKARELGIDINRSGYVYCFPVNAGWVGGDNIAVMLTTEIYEKPETSLVIDIGTNGEVAIGNEEKCYVCSTAAGPALEGGNIKFGMRAAPGAIETVKIDPKDLEPTIQTIDSAEPRGICGSGIIDIVAEMYRSGILRSDGRFKEQLKNNKRIRKNEKGIKEYVLVSGEDIPSGSEIVITQKDVREIQKAKGAIQAGARVLMDKLNTEDVDRVFLAGAFGNKIDKISALRIGLFPDCELDKVEGIGNAAGSGSQIALINKEKRREAEKIPEIVEYVEIAGTEKFRQEYMDAMYIPHRDQDLYEK